MSSADDDSQQIASPEAVDSAPSEGTEDVASLPELAVIGAAAEEARSAETPDSEASKSSETEQVSARDRLNSRNSRKREERPRKKRGGVIALVVIIVILLGAIGSAIGGLAYLYWYANDDALDFQGTWYVAGTDTPIEITADSIQLTESVAYRYKLNTRDKTITLTLGNMTGYGSYRFSLDRDQLVIFDGRADANAVLESNVRWLIQALFDQMQNDPNDVTSGIRRNRTLLTREPNTFPVYADTSTSTDAPASSSDSDQATEPQTVWSAEDWMNNSASDGESDAAGSSTGSSTTSNANDVGSLLDGINDLPANDTVPASNEPATPEDAAS